MPVKRSGLDAEPFGEPARVELEGPVELVPDLLEFTEQRCGHTHGAHQERRELPHRNPGQARLAQSHQPGGIAGHPVQRVRDGLHRDRVEVVGRRAAGLDQRVDPVPSIGELSVALGERDLVEFVALDDELLSVTVADGRATLRRLASATEVAKEVGKDGIVVLNLSGRGDKDVATVAAHLGRQI